MPSETSDVFIHPTAIVDPKARLGRGTHIGPYSIVGPDVIMGENCEIQEHVVVRGITTLGNKVKVYPFSVVGGEPQHLKYNNEPTTTTIGDETVLREMVTVNRGTDLGIGTTTVGSNCLIMAYAHVAHDCVVGSNVILCNSVQLGGHATIEDFATLGGVSAVAQFCRVGRYCYVAGGSILRKDLPPFLTGKGGEFEVQGINAVGMTRRGFVPETLQKLKALYKIFYMQHLTVSQAIEKAMTEMPGVPEVQSFIEFVQNSKMGFVR